MVTLIPPWLRQWQLVPVVHVKMSNIQFVDSI